MENNDFKITVEQLAKKWEAWRHDKIIERFSKHQYEIVQVQYNKVWCKLVIAGSGVQAFIAPADGQNKTVGPYKAGDIFMPASWNAPAKHKRGSIYDKEPLNCFTEWGVKYL